MEFARKVWKLLVALKDGLALLFLLLFFMALYAVLSFRPGAPGPIHKGALVLELNGTIVEEASVPDPVARLLSSEAPVNEYAARDIVRALRLAAKDDRINSVVLDLTGFIGGGIVHLHDIGAAIDEVRAAKKPVLAYGIAYLDDGMLLAAHADEVWIDPNGGAFITGPGGNHLYFGKLLEKLKVTANIYRVGTFKSAVEPWILDGPSEASNRAMEAVYGAQWEAWKTDYAKARPTVDVEGIVSDPVAWIRSAGGDAPEAGKSAGMVDMIGSKTEFGMRVAEIAGKDKRDKTPGSYAGTPLRNWLAANKETKSGETIGVVTIAGEIVDGDAGPGIAGGGRIARLLDKALEDDLKALVVRVDSPGGSVIASEQIRAAIERHKKKGIPVIVSMANLAASGGYWVSTPADHIFAEPATITGSIGIFAIVPSFEKALSDIGVTGGGVKTTPLSGQPDVLTGLAPEFSPMMQASIENGYRKFVTLVSKSRGISPDRAADWAEGRPWSGGDARQIGLVDQFGGLDDAIAYAAKAAKLKDGEWHAQYLGGGADPLSMLLHRVESGEARSRVRAVDLAGLAAQRQQDLLDQAASQARWLFSVRGIQAFCLECPARAGQGRHEPLRNDDVLVRMARLIGLAGN